MSHPSFKTSFSRWWQSKVQGRGEGFRFLRKLNSIKEKFKSWNREVLGDVRVKNKDILGKLEAFHMPEETEERLLEAVKEERLNLKVGFAEITRKECASGDSKSRS